MKLELKQKELYNMIFPILNGLVGGRYEVKPGIVLECPLNLKYEIRKSPDGVYIIFPKSDLKVVASKWLFQMDGFITCIKLVKDKIIVEIQNLPDLLIDLV